MTEHKDEVNELRIALSRGESVFAIHYACESFLSAKNHPPGIASIAMYDVITRDVVAFSRSDALPDLNERDQEIDLLTRYYGRLASINDSRFIHWNMNRPEFSFSALRTRYRYLTGEEPSTLEPRRRHDVDSLFVDRFGTDYAPHGKLESTARLNGLDMRSFLTGREEAEQFTAGGWSILMRSSASKAKIIGELLQSFVRGSIKTSGSAGQIEFAGSRLDAVDTVLELGSRLLLVQRSLSKHPHGKTPITFENEYDDQYLVRALLVQFFDDVRDEEYTPSYGGGNSRIDFLLPEFKLAVELKHTRSGLKDKDLGEQIIVDRERYGTHPDVTHLMILVFDHSGLLRSPRALEKDLQREHSSPDLTVTVRIYDR